MENIRKDIVLLGSTGSVGRNVLEVVRRYPDRFRIKALSSNSNHALLREQAEEFRPEKICLADVSSYAYIAENPVSGVKVCSGSEGLEELVLDNGDALVFIAISGMAALRPLMFALKKGRKVALASKEPIVSAGSIVMDMARSNGSVILPVDSEHSAIMACLGNSSVNIVRTLYITGSGGSLADKPLELFDSLSIERVLDHPKWDMGPKITVDSATLMNKGLEMIEARWLFDIEPEKIKVVIHPEAVVHSMIEFIDGTITANLFFPDMKFPILRALVHPDMIETDFPRMNIPGAEGLTFREPDRVRFPALGLAYEAIALGGTMPSVLNSANETAVKLFLEGKIKFTKITELVERVMSKHKINTDPRLEDILDSERWAAEEVLGLC